LVFGDVQRLAASLKSFLPFGFVVLAVIDASALKEFGNFMPKDNAAIV
jgi:hypothetical protein